jgi:RNA polymerase sigma factor (sigma-70 family)
MKQRFHLAKRRAVNRETDPSGGSSESEQTLEQGSEDSPPDEPVLFAEQLKQAMELLDPLEREVLQLKLEDYTHEEIAERVHRSDRTIRRVVVRIQEKLRGTLGG